MENSMVGSRLRSLREGLKISQQKLATVIGTNQAAINRYENNTSSPPEKILLWYADYFDVSLDYIFGRTDKPEGKLYEYKPQAIKEKAAQNKEIRQFVEMCFDPSSSINGKLKDALVRMMMEGQE